MAQANYQMSKIEILSVILAYIQAPTHWQACQNALATYGGIFGENLSVKQV